MPPAKDNRQLPRALIGTSPAGILAHKAIVYWLPVLYFLISSLFYLRTYDSAQVKITVMQMGGVALLALWVARLLEARGAAFTKDDLVCLSPFLAYLTVGILSFIHAPYLMASVDFFLRHCFFMIAALVVIYEFEAEAVKRLTRWLIAAAWVAVGYGALQWFDAKFFPPGIGNGIDPFIWRGAFGNRIFSTYGNPNFFADFLVIVFPILLFEAFKTRSWKHAPLIALLAFDLVETYTKGAWVAFGISLILAAGIGFVYFEDQIRAFKRWIIGGVAAGLLVFGGVFMRDIEARLGSVNFRLFTWEATWEIIMTQPWIGTGIGSFPPCYPAYRRPPIFHIEGKHNTETDHAEDEYLEEILDNGILGFGVFIWLIASTVWVGLKSLRRLVTTFKLKDGRPPPEAYELAGYLVAFVGMLAHNFFDVSMRFVSSGVYLGLLSGVIVNMSRGRALYELHRLRDEEARGSSPARPAAAPEPAKPSSLKLISEFLIWPMRIAGWGALLYVIFVKPGHSDPGHFRGIIGDFNHLQGPVDQLALGGEILQWYLSWAVLLACVLGLGYVFARLIFLSENPIVPAVIALSLWPLYTFWGYFKADIHHNMAIYLSKQRNWNAAIKNYNDVTRLNPYFPMSRYFLGNVFTDRFSMDKVYNPGWGDKDNVPRDDYERALASYDGLRRLAPNYVQMHYQVGVLHMKRADWAARQGRAAEAREYLQKALNRFQLYSAIDPVYGPSFYRQAQIYMIEKRYSDAARVLKSYLYAPQCAVSPSLIKKPFLRRTILSYQKYYDEPGVPYPVHLHPEAEGFTALGNAYFLMGDWRKAQWAYNRSLALDPNFSGTARNLQTLYQKARDAHRLKAYRPAGSTVTVYEITPAKA
jgi:O-antigen ligase/tetratricopeptide (TPR) repeat protein